MEWVVLPCCRCVRGVENLPTEEWLHLTPEEPYGSRALHRLYQIVALLAGRVVVLVLALVVVLLLDLVSKVVKPLANKSNTHQNLLLWASSPVSLAATGERRSADVPATDEPGHRPEHGVRAQALAHQPVRLRRVRPQPLLRAGKLKF